MEFEAKSKKLPIIQPFHKIHKYKKPKFSKFTKILVIKIASLVNIRVSLLKIQGKITIFVKNNEN